MKSLSNGLSVSFVRVFCLRAMLLFGFLLVMLAGAQSARAAGPCCGIKSIDLKTGIVAATENATGREFTFKVTNATLLHSLKVGQGIYANFATKQVSVDGLTPCCTILSLGQSQKFGPIDSAKFAPIDSAKFGPIDSAKITSIDAATGVVTALAKSSGQSFQFKVAGAGLLNSLKVSQAVYANFATKQVSVDGVVPCCNILSLAASPSGTAQLGSKAKPLGPCCTITAINAQTGIVTASENATGRTFSFKVTGAGLLNSLKVGQGIYANFATKQVSVDGVVPCCSVQ